MHSHYLSIEQRESLERVIRERVSDPLQLRNALERLHSADYGVCIECGRDIAYARLKEDPAALHCQSCSRLPIPVQR